MYTFDQSLFPIIRVNFFNNLNDNQFNNFLSQWENLYNHKKNFIMIFYTQNLDSPSIQQCFQISSFIKKIKNNYPPYLNKSIFIIQNYIIEKLLYFIFFIQKPISNIYIIKNYNSNINIEYEINNVINNISSQNIIFIPLT